MTNKKGLILRYEGILSILYRLIGRNRKHVDSGNHVNVGNAFMKKCMIRICGKGNTLEIASGLTRLINSSILIRGNNCTIKIQKGAILNDVHLHIEDDNGIIIIGEHAAFTGYTELACIEGKTIEIGGDCLFSNKIVLRTGDSHSILNSETGERINPSEDIKIGKHVWIGQDVKILKGVTVGDDSIVSTGAVLTKNTYPANCVCGGIGGKVLKTGVNWNYQRL